MRVVMHGEAEVTVALSAEEARALLRAMDGVDHLDADRESDRRVYNELVRSLGQVVRG